MFDKKRLKNEIIVLDGAFGTELQKRGLLSLGECPERLNLTRPEEVEKISRAYAEAGAQILMSNTFGANPHKLPAELSVAETVAAGVAAAKRAAEPFGAAVALDVGPLGELMEPMGKLTFQEAYACFAEMMKCGENAGADLIAIETMTDLAEVRAAILAAKENTGLPVFCTMTFEENGRTFTGCDAEAFALAAEGLGADAIGVNCSLGPAQLLPVVKKLARRTDLPLIVKANAGLPLPDGSYSVGAEEFCRDYGAFLELGVSVVGGCCGTDPAYISGLKKLTAGKCRTARPKADRAAVCSGTRVLPLDGVRVVGERLNPTGKPLLKKAYLEGDSDYVISQAVSQIDAGAEILDVNVGVPGIDEPAAMQRTVRAVQSACNAPLQIDSSDPKAVEAALRVYCGKAIVNSVNGDEESLSAVLPLVKKYGATVIGLTLDKNGIPSDADARIAIAKRIAASAEALGIPKHDLIFDCLTLTVSAEQPQVKETLAAIRTCKQMGYRTALGVSNVSFGLPRRELVNAAFLCLALGAGLDLPITNPNIPANMDAIRAFCALSGQDENCADYIEHYAGTATAVAVIAGSPAPQAPAAPAQAPARQILPQASHSPSSNIQATRSSPLSKVQAPENDLAACIVKGLPEAAARTRELLETLAPLDVVEKHLIPALDEVGKLYERGTLFLPQLIRSAETAKLGFEEVRRALAGTSAPDKGTVVLATVHGDVHDIGKNIVKVVLENYGYRIVDLGKNVPKEDVVKAVLAEKAKLVGLSALMTTTVASMKETISALREACDCKVMAGGAVLTEEYARSIGADYYAKDANDSVRIAREVLG